MSDGTHVGHCLTACAHRTLMICVSALGLVLYTGSQFYTGSQCLAQGPVVQHTSATRPASFDKFHNLPVVPSIHQFSTENAPDLTVAASAASSNEPARPSQPHVAGQHQTLQPRLRTASAQLTPDDFGVLDAENQLSQDPTPSASLRVPFQDLRQTDAQLRIQGGPQQVSIYAQNVDIRVVLANLAMESKVNIVVAENVNATVTTTLSNVSLWDALDAILKINGLVWTQNQNIIFVTKPGGDTQQEVQSSSMPGQNLQVFDLNFTSSAEVITVVQGLLSPGGKAFVHAVDATNSRQTRERIVVEDYPERIQAIAQYLATVDNAPKQVLIEAHVLQVNLDDDQRHGVNLLGLARVAGARFNIQAQGFANADASPGFMMGVEGGDLGGMIEMLKSNSAVRTLAAPKVLVVNGQQARIQIGSKFGYFVTTTTQTSTLQSVDFLDIGVVLQVQPTITADGQIMLAVQPKVSGGRINPDNGLPEEDTTEAETTVLLPDGQGMIIGGLIKESDDHKRSGIPWLGDQPIIGKLFSRSNDDVSRVEVIIALTPHIVPYCEGLNNREYEDYRQATSSTVDKDYYATPGPYGAVTFGTAPYGTAPYATGSLNTVYDVAEPALIEQQLLQNQGAIQTFDARLAAPSGSLPQNLGPRNSTLNMPSGLPQVPNN